MIRLIIFMLMLLPNVTFAHPSDYPNGVEPQKVDNSAKENSQAFESKNANKPSLDKLVKDDSFKNLIQIGFAIAAMFSWLGFFANFDPQIAFQQTLIPAMLTFLSFQWIQVAHWLGIF